MLVPASILFASLEIRPASAAGAAESVGSAVEQEQPAEPASERIEELVARLAALQAALEAVLDELHATLDEPDRSADPPIDPIRVGDGISPPTRIHGVAPIYPPEAVTAGVEGIVVLKATIGPTGDVTDVEILRSVPLLDEAAVATVSEWRYAPMLVDGEPAGIQMTVNVDFTLPSPLREMRNDPPVRGCRRRQGSGPRTSHCPESILIVSRRLIGIGSVGCGWRQSTLARMWLATFLLIASAACGSGDNAQWAIVQEYLDRQAAWEARAGAIRDILVAGSGPIDGKIRRAEEAYGEMPDAAPAIAAAREVVTAGGPQTAEAAVFLIDRSESLLGSLDTQRKLAKLVADGMAPPRGYRPTQGSGRPDLGGAHCTCRPRLGGRAELPGWP